MERPRQYHSTASLLADGSVLVAGGETDRFCNCSQVGKTSPCPTAEIYYPGYLNRGARPTIYTFDPGLNVMHYGQPFSIGTPDAGNITSVVLIRPSAVTHSFNMEQRYVQLYIANQSPNTGVTVQAPKNENIAPPGYYMLFIIKNDALGRAVPSEAAFIQLVR